MSSFISLIQQKNYLNTTNNTHEFMSKKRGWYVQRAMNRREDFELQFVKEWVYNKH